ncbi:LysR family transcriptional regulator [Thermopolyspora sp. NPDC052614]|uniref:LysR family transcriptional regulator n=1 Tax=Thermopolyspora sp. NPDC052614 TaxID=3155682 RepID=UPI00343791C0
MRLRQLEYFIAICEYGSFSAAAAQLLVAQPSLSQQIRALEREVGAKLLERGRQGVTLTAAGRVFLPRARSVIDAVEAARRAVADVVGGLDGELHVLTVRSVASGVLPAGIVRWHEKYPATVLRLHDYSHRRDLETAMRAGHGDVAIGPRPRNWDGDIVSLGFESLVVAGRGPYDAERASVAELAAGKWIHFEPEQGMSEVVDWAARSLGFTPRTVARVGQVAASLNLAVQGVGFALIPANAVPPGWERHVRPLEPPLYRELVAYGRGPMMQLVRRFVDLLNSVELPLVSRAGVPADALVC